MYVATCKINIKELSERTLVLQYQKCNCILHEYTCHTSGDVDVLGLMEAISVCRKMNVSTTVSAMLSLLSLSNEMNTEAIPVKVTSTIGTSRLNTFKCGK